MRTSAQTRLPLWLQEDLQKKAGGFSVVTGAEEIWQNPKGCVKDRESDAATTGPIGQPAKVCHLLSLFSF